MNKVVNSSIFRRTRNYGILLALRHGSHGHGHEVESKYPKIPFRGMVHPEHPDDDKWKLGMQYLKADLIDDKYEYRYRSGFRGATSSVDYYYNKYIIAGIFWGWIIYRVYYDYQVLLVEPEWWPPELEKFTDKELGIPDDGTIPQRLYTPKRDY